MLDLSTAVGRVMKGLNGPIRLMIGLFVFGVILVDMVGKIYGKER
jgi:hypothetical protein